VKVVHLKGDRRDHFETVQDPWDLLRILVRERKEREFDPTVAFLRDCVASPDFARADPQARRQVTETLALMEALGSWADQMLGMDDAVLKRLVKLGAKVRSFLKAA
jgi:DNA-binding transcriptional regulator GbsR (MarR family)